MLNKIIRTLFYILSRILIGNPNQDKPEYSSPVIYYANHSSNIDSIVLWLSLTDEGRQNTCFIAAGDYWDKGLIRPYILKNIFNGIAINRTNINRDNNPVDIMERILREGKNIIIFPEGTRNIISEDIQDFKSGLYHIARRLPEISLIPIYLLNTQRMMPKGTFLPIPILCQSFFGEPFTINEPESKTDFLNNARTKLEELKP